MKNEDNWLVLLEPHKLNPKVNLFEKVIVMTKRAKSLYTLEASALAGLTHKPTFQAILESNDGRLTMKRIQPEDLEEE